MGRINRHLLLLQAKQAPKRKRKRKVDSTDESEEEGEEEDIPSDVTISADLASVSGNPEEPQDEEDGAPESQPTETGNEPSSGGAPTWTQALKISQGLNMNPTCGSVCRDLMAFAELGALLSVFRLHHLREAWHAFRDHVKHGTFGTYTAIRWAQSQNWHTK